MKVKTNELTGAALDWAVAKCEGEEVSLIKGQLEARWTEDGYKPSADWAQGGPIIEREVITLIHPKYDCWTAHKYDDRIEDESYTLDGPTPLIAAMRCYVASQLGDEVDVPEDLQ